jgi:hypothetical protein
MMVETKDFSNCCEVSINEERWLRLKISQIVVKYPSIKNYGWIITVQKLLLKLKVYIKNCCKRITGKKFI